jgi:hypothetical protein
MEKLGTEIRDVHEIINFCFFNDLFRWWTGRISIPLSSSCPGKVDESSFHISPYELNSNSISDIKILSPSDQLSLHYYQGAFKPSVL